MPWENVGKCMHGEIYHHNLQRYGVRKASLGKTTERPTWQNYNRNCKTKLSQNPLQIPLWNIGIDLNTDPGSPWARGPTGQRYFVFSVPKRNCSLITTAELNQRPCDEEACVRAETIETARTQEAISWIKNDWFIISLLSWIKRIHLQQLAVIN